jgi:transposase
MPESPPGLFRQAQSTCIIEPLLQVRETLRVQLAVLNRQVRGAARDKTACRRLRTMPGVGAVIDLIFRSKIDTWSRFCSLRLIGPFLGLTLTRSQSRETDRPEDISLSPILN